ncbi:MAG TPA: hypothetical protein VEV83_05945, partial [Parafilimonas sp.]|nr:hypothetical protein [Parafilimonas sp.]
MKILTLFLVACMSLTITICFSQAGTLDSTFGNGGKVITHFGSYLDGGGSAMALQADGKIVVAGTSSDSNEGDFAVARYNSDGELDSSFGVDGKLMTDLNDSSDHASSVNVLDDGKILVTGYILGSSRLYFAMVRYTSNGTIDSSFGVDGKVISDLAAGGHNVLILPDGKILLDAGVGLEWPNSAFFMTRFNPNGTPDSSFGVNGFGDTIYFKDAFSNSAIALQNDGKIIVGGSAGVTQGDGSYFEALRLNANGTIDKNFGSNGRVITFHIWDWAHSFAVIVQPDGKIIQAGDRYLRDDLDFALVRYKPNGELDSTFGLDGIASTNFGNEDDLIQAIAIQSDGKIVAAGFSGHDSLGFTRTYDFALARYTQNGQPDSSFGRKGRTTTDFANGGDYGDIANAVSVQADGKIVLAGSAGNDFALARYNNNDGVLASGTIALKAYSVGGNVKIEWISLNELNISQYNVERSVDGKNFISIANIKAQNNGEPKTEYSYTDFYPANGENFYRIKSISKDGVVKYTSVVKVNFVSASS